MSSSNQSIGQGKLPSFADQVHDFGETTGFQALGHNETFSDLKVFPLLTKGVADHEFRRGAIIGAKGDMDTYSSIYFQNKKQYRRSYSPAKLATLGYLPTSTAVTYSLDSAAVLAYIVTNYNANANAIQYLREGAATLSQVSHYELQAYPQWSTTTSIWTESVTAHYPYVSATKINATDLSVTLRRNFTENIHENLTTYYSYDAIGNTVVLQTGPTTVPLSGTSGVDTVHIDVRIYDSLSVLVDTISFDIASSTPWSTVTGAYGNGTYTVEVSEIDSLSVTTITSTYPITIDASELYNVGVLDNTIIADEYTVNVYRVSDSALVQLFVPVEYLYKIVPSALYDTETMQVKYGVSTGSEVYWYIEDVTTLPPTLRVGTTVDVTAIVPLKVANSINPEGGNLSKMLGLLNVDYKSIAPSLNNADVSDVYLIYGIPLGTTDPACYEALFKTFDLVRVNGNVNISISRLSMNYQYTSTRETTIGVIGAVDQYFKTISSVYDPETMEEQLSMKLQWQVTSEEYITITITDYLNTFSIAGQNYAFQLNSLASEARVLLPISVIRSLKYREFTNVHEESLAMAAFAIKTVYIEFYETPAFQAIMMIVAIVISAFSQQWYLTAIVAAAGYVIDQLVDWGIISPEVGAALRVVVAVIAIFYGGVGTSGSALFFQAVNTGIAIGNAMLSWEQQDLLKQMAEDNLSREQMAEEVAALKERNGEFRNETAEYLAEFYFDMGFATRPDSAFNSTEKMCYVANGYVVDQPQHLFELDSKFARSKEVYSNLE